MRLKDYSFVDSIAREYGFEPNLIRRIITVESGGDADALRLEPAFWARYIKGKPLTGFVPARDDKDNEITGDDYEQYTSELTERCCRSYSFGLMQIMLTTAREIGGYKASDPGYLAYPHTNVTVGCRVLRHYVDREGGSLDDGISSYNTGRPLEFRNKAGRIMYNRDGHIYLRKVESAEPVTA